MCICTVRPGAVTDDSLTLEAHCVWHVSSAAAVTAGTLLMRAAGL
jgi:hypothetical protein